MKVLYIAPYCFGLEESFGAAFRATGADVEQIIYARHEEGKGRVVRALYNHAGLVRGAKRLLNWSGLLAPWQRRKLGEFNDRILGVARRFQPDLVFVVKGETLFPDTLRALARSATLVSYHWDDPFLSHVARTDGTGDLRYRNLRSSYPIYDATFVYDEHYIPLLREQGARNVFYLMDWYEPEFYRPLELNAEDRRRYGSQVAFVGSPYPNRIELLGRLQEFDVSVWGPAFRWKEHDARYPFLKKQYRGEAPAPEAVKVYNAADIVLNIHDTFQCFTSTNNRTFQILASGALQMIDDRPKVHALFDVGRDLVTFTDPDDAHEKVRHLLANPDEMRDIRRRGLEKARGHASTDRVKQVLSTLKTLDAGRREAVR